MFGPYEDVELIGGAMYYLQKERSANKAPHIPEEMLVEAKDFMKSFSDLTLAHGWSFIPRCCIINTGGGGSGR